MPGTEKILGLQEAVFNIFRLLFGKVIFQKEPKFYWERITHAQKVAQALIFAQNFAAWATFPHVLLH
jgi:hypothetical protein